MAIPHAKSGEVVDVRPFGASLADKSTRTIVKTDDLEVIRIVLPAGKELPPHNVPGEITVQCIEGAVEFRAGASPRQLTAGDFLYLQGGTEHSMRATADSSVLLSILLKRKDA